MCHNSFINCRAKSTNGTPVCSRCLMANEKRRGGTRSLKQILERKKAAINNQQREIYPGVILNYPEDPTEILC